MKKRVVITGCGVVSSLGHGINNFWKSIKTGQCGISKIEKFDVSGLATKVGAEIKDFKPSDFINKKELKRMDNFTKYAVVASDLAIENANLNTEKLNKDRFGVIVGSGIGGMETLENQHNILISKGAKRVSPFFIPMLLPNMATGLISIRYKAKGYNETPVSACATSSNAIGNAYRIIQSGISDIIISGGSESALCRLAFSGFCANKAMTTNPDPLDASKPFDLKRDGFVMGEGAGIVIMEEYEHAIKRGAKIIAEIIGYGCTNDAFHMTAMAENGEGCYNSMQLALKDANLEKEKLDYINAHGTSTPINDKNETMAIKNLFGKHSKNLFISSSKSMTGHLLGATGAIETIICAKSLEDNFIPPTINYKTPDPECDLNYIPNKGIYKEINYAMTNSSGFGGHNVSLILKSSN
jgi:3-oxoacyl-[acyl-carrier-protein] synthase II